MLFYDYLTDFIFTENVPENADIIFVPGGGYGEDYLYELNTGRIMDR